MKIDLHVHSCYSREPSVYLLRKIGINECYVDPFDVYKLAKQRGMDAVTITDHDSIEGCLRIVHLPDTFMGCEVTATFPDEFCQVHVLVYHVSEEQFGEINRLRENVHDLIDYLNKQRIRYVLAHPFYTVNNRLTVEVFEKCLLLFGCYEISGEQPPSLQRRLRQTLASLTPELIERLINKHDILPLQAEPWQKHLVGGSDDHSGIYLGNTYTEVTGAARMEDFWRGVDSDHAAVRYHTVPTPLTRAHHQFSIAYQFNKERFKLNSPWKRVPLIRFLDSVLDAQKPGRLNGLHRQVHRMFARRIERLCRKNPKDTAFQFLSLVQKTIENDAEFQRAMAGEQLVPAESQRLWVRFFNLSVGQMLGRITASALNDPAGVNLFSLGQTLGAAGSVLATMGPFIGTFVNFGKERQLAVKVMDQLNVRNRPARRTHVGVFTDTLDEVNGVARSWRMQADIAQRTGKELTIVACRSQNLAPCELTNVQYFDPVAVQELPEYPQQKLAIPPFLEMLNFAYEQNFTCIQSPAPGPVGLTGLAIARLLRIPFYSTYHTHIPQYARYLSDDDTTMEDLAWKFVLWFYSQAETTFAPSRETAELLIERGIRRDRIRLMHRGVDIERFHPNKAMFAPTLPDGFKFLYVGRVSREKNLPVLVSAFRRLAREYPGTQLVVAGDGPYLEQMKADLADAPAFFTGVIEGDELTGTYAASDAFVFPSTTDTFGNVVLEAQASGISVIVTDQGGPCENLVPGQTGTIVAGQDAGELYRAMKRLLDEPQKCRAMGANARKYAEGRSIERAFELYWQYYEEELPGVPAGQISGQSDVAKVEWAL